MKNASQPWADRSVAGKSPRRRGESLGNHVEIRLLVFDGSQIPREISKVYVCVCMYVRCTYVYLCIYVYMYIQLFTHLFDCLFLYMYVAKWR